MNPPAQHPASNSEARKRAGGHQAHPDPEVRALMARAWDEGNRHESEYLDTWGQFDPSPVNPYRSAS